MPDSNSPHENHLKGRFRGLLDWLMSTDRPPNEHPHPSSSRLEFMTPTLADSILTRYRSTFMRGPEVTGGGMSLVCVYNVQINSLAHILLSLGLPECNAGSSQLHYKGYNTLCHSKCVYCDNSIHGLRI